MAEVTQSDIHGRITALARNLAQRRGQSEGYAQQDWQAAESQVMEELSLTQGNVWKAEYICEQPAPDMMEMGQGKPGAMSTGATREEMEEGAFKNEYLGQ